jgi:hypothetical protein
LYGGSLRIILIRNTADKAIKSYLYPIHKSFRYFNTPKQNQFFLNKFLEYFKNQKLGKSLSVAGCYKLLTLYNTSLPLADSVFDKIRAIHHNYTISNTFNKVVGFNRLKDVVDIDLFIE